MSKQQAVAVQGEESGLITKGFRIPYPAIAEQKYGIDKGQWQALTEAVFPGATKWESIFLALEYCKWRKLDPFKRTVHIVPIWDSEARVMKDTVWPGIAELRTTAHRTGQYAGRDKTEFGPDRELKLKSGKVLVYPEWAQVTVYRLIKGERVPYAGPQVYWMETCMLVKKTGEPNEMWQRRARGQLDKCAEAAALRAAFPEELGDEFAMEEAGMLTHFGGVPHPPTIDQHAPRAPRRSDFAPKQVEQQTPNQKVSTASPPPTRTADAQEPPADEADGITPPRSSDAGPEDDDKGQQPAEEPRGSDAEEYVPPKRPTIVPVYDQNGGLLMTTESFDDWIAALREHKGQLGDAEAMNLMKANEASLGLWENMGVEDVDVLWAELEIE